MTVRGAVHAGSFYPADGDRLAAQIARWLMAVAPLRQAPKALIVPHAGYQYSGAVAAAGFAQLKEIAGQIHTVVLMGPNHRVPLTGVALPSCQAFATPLGQVLVDSHALSLLAASAVVSVNDQAHALEHALEVQLPFLQLSLEQFEIIPLVVGDIAPEPLSDLLLPFWQDPGCLLVVSSDLSHFQGYEEARRHDQQTIQRVQRQATDLGGADACGCRAINGLMQLLGRMGGDVRFLQYCNSGDTAGDKSRVVGYASFAVYPEP